MTDDLMSQPTIPGAKLYRGIWFPEDEQHMIDWMETSKHKRDVGGRPTYQYNKLEQAVNVCRAAGRLGVAVDCGAHVGLWTMHLVKVFAAVHAFEPHPLHYRLLTANVPDDNLFPYQCALGDTPSRTRLRNSGVSSGDTHLHPEGSGPEVPVVSLDQYDLTPDFIKIDVEGYELPLLMGAEKTLERSSPVVVLEQKGVEQRNYQRPKDEALKWLRQRGWRSVAVISGDHLMIRRA